MHGEPQTMNQARDNSTTRKNTHRGDQDIVSCERSTKTAQKSTHTHTHAHDKGSLLIDHHRHAAVLLWLKVKKDSFKSVVITVALESPCDRASELGSCGLILRCLVWHSRKRATTRQTSVIRRTPDSQRLSLSLQPRSGNNGTGP